MTHGLVLQNVSWFFTV